MRVWLQGTVEDDLVSVSHGERTQKLQEASSTEDSFISQCQAECWCAPAAPAVPVPRPCMP